MTSTHRTVNGSEARMKLLRGAERMTALLRPTLGPLARTVVVGRLIGADPPEVLDSGATIARRTLQLADPFEDMGAMLIRHLAWRTHDQVGDGSSTAAVLASAMMQMTLGYVGAGGNPVGVRRGLELGLHAALGALCLQARTIDGPADITQLIASAIRDPDLAGRLGEVIDSAGPDGAILVEDAHTTHTTCEYLDGVRWNEGYFSTFLLRPNVIGGARLLNPRILVTDYLVSRAEDLLPCVEACVAAGERVLFIVAPELKDSAIGFLSVNRDHGVLDDVMAVRAPSMGDQRAHILEDLAVITGGHCVSHARGDRLADVTIDDLGTARQAWATSSAFGILGGGGSKARIRQRIAEARAELSGTQKLDVFTTTKIQERIGKLAGTSAIVRVGAPTSAEQAELKLRIEAAIRSARAALDQGVVAGGGAALLACVPALLTMDVQGDEALGVNALAHALAEPMRTILTNAGFDAGPIVERARACDQVYDVVRQQWVDPWVRGLVDPASVVRTALETSVSAAAVCLTADVLIHRPDGSVSTQP
ncbi:MAG TPA: chaperonin GroEL [Chloroflexota bacterium]